MAEEEKAAEKRPRRAIGETEVVRWFCYAGFAVCSVLLVVALTFNARWFPSAVGVLVWGVPALFMYKAEQARRENVAVARAKAAEGGRSGGRERFKGLDEAGTGDWS